MLLHRREHGSVTPVVTFDVDATPNHAVTIVIRDTEGRRMRNGIPRMNLSAEDVDDLIVMLEYYKREAFPQTA